MVALSRQNCIPPSRSKKFTCFICSPPMNLEITLFLQIPSTRCVQQQQQAEAVSKQSARRPSSSTSSVGCSIGAYHAMQNESRLSNSTPKLRQYTTTCILVISRVPSTIPNALPRVMDSKWNKWNQGMWDRCKAAHYPTQQSLYVRFHD